MVNCKNCDMPIKDCPVCKKGYLHSDGFHSCRNGKGMAQPPLAQQVPDET